MPKMKTHRGAAKRFKVTGSGKFMKTRHTKAIFWRKNPASGNVNFAMLR